MVARSAWYKTHWRPQDSGRNPRDLFLERYLERLPRQLAELDEHCRDWRPKFRLEPPSSLAHRLAGSAGLHHLDQVADRARKLEAALSALEHDPYRPLEAADLLSPLRVAVQEARTAARFSGGDWSSDGAR